jgi:hypothetical protein
MGIGDAVVDVLGNFISSLLVGCKYSRGQLDCT